jgi:hypothetical protein
MTWAKLSATLEPYNYHRKVIGFDTFEGFPEGAITAHDGKAKAGDYAGDMGVLMDCVHEFDRDRPIAHKRKVELVKGDVRETIPRYLRTHSYLFVSLLFMDLDIYTSTKAALAAFLPLMLPGSVVAFDELNNPDWKGEAQALRECGIRGELRCFPWEPNISYMVMA